MQLPKQPKNPLNSLPFFSDPEDPYPFQTYMFQVFRNLAVTQATQVENLSKELLSWVLSEWFTAMDNAITKRENGKEFGTVVVSKEVLEFTLRTLSEMRGTKRKKIELVPESQDLSDELKKNGMTPKSPVPKEELNALKESEVFNTAVPSKERKKKPVL